MWHLKMYYKYIKNKFKQGGWDPNLLYSDRPVYLCTTVTKIIHTGKAKKKMSNLHHNFNKAKACV